MATATRRAAGHTRSPLMAAQRVSLRMGAVVVLMSLLVATSSAGTETWLKVEAPGGLFPQEAARAASPATTVEASDLTGLQVTARTEGLVLRPRENKAGRFVELTWPEAKVWGEVGTPAIPVIRELFVVPAGAQVSLSVVPGLAAVIDAELAGGSPPGRAP